jgi:glycine cleavage system protein P-like pyridoxal-binding family
VGGLALSRWYPDMENDLLIAVTELHTRAQLDRFADALGRIG